MPVRRDYAFTVPANTAAETLLRAARQADRALITNATLFDVYQLPDGQTSLAVEITLQPTSQTLTDADLEAFSAKLVASVVKATGARLR
jgi:phenylalanyl-tRNA synthetase beta chain